MSSDALGWAWHITTGDPSTKALLVAMAELTQPPDRWGNSKLSVVRHLVHSPLGISMGSQKTLMRYTDIKSTNTLTFNLNLLMAAGLMLPAHQDIALTWANGYANQAPNAYEPNAVIDSRREENPWIAEVISEAKKIFRKGAEASQYGDLGEVVRDLCPLSRMGFTWVETVTADRHKKPGGHWVPSDRATNRLDDKRTPRGRVVLRLVRDVAVEGVETPKHWVDAENAATPTGQAAADTEPAETTSPPEPDVAGGQLFATPGRLTPEGLPPLGKQPPGGPKQDVWRRENYRWEQTAERPTGKKKKKRDGQEVDEVKFSECAWLIADTRFRDYDPKPVGRDGGQKFLVHHQRIAQAMLNEGRTPEHIIAGLRQLDLDMPSEGAIRQVLRGREPSRRTAMGGAVEGIAAANEGAGKAYVETEENRRRRLELMAAFQQDAEAESQ